MIINIIYCMFWWSSKDGANFLELVGLSIYLEEELKVPVDVVPVDAARKEIKKQVLEEAVPI
jgi:predicted nucleotidyltransferase